MLIKNSMQIRPANVKDASAISDLIKRLSPFFIAHPDGAGTEPFFAKMSAEKTAQLISSSNCSYWVAEVDGQFVGVVAMRDHTHLFHLFVDERFHRMGIATQLWDVAKAFAQKAGNKQGFTVNSSPYAVQLYERLGFKAVGERSEKDGILFIPMYLSLPAQEVSQRDEPAGD